MESILDTARALRRGETDPVALVEYSLCELRRWEPQLRSSITILEDRAFEAAERARTELEQGLDRGTLHGIPIAVKDLIDIAGVPTTAGSKILHDNIPPSSAPLVVDLEKAGAVIISKTNTHEFAFGALTPPTRNPLDLRLMPGGSSGGSAAIVGAGIVRAALGTDTGGSIREPAALCGVVGLKPSAGRTSTTGVVPLAWSLDTVGPIAATVPDCSVLFEVIASHVSPASTRNPPSISGLSISVWAELTQRMQAAVRSAYLETLDKLSDAGANIEERPLGDPDALVAAALVIIGAEALSYHLQWYETRRTDYQTDVLAYLDLASTFTAADLVDAQRLRRYFTKQIDLLVQKAGILVTPGQLVLAPVVTDDQVVFDDSRTGPRDLTLIRPLAPFNLTGHPAITVPVTKDSLSGLPVSIQLVGARNSDENLLSLAGQVQTICQHEWSPPDFTAIP